MIKKLLIFCLLISLFSACQSNSWQVYENNQLSFEYPNSYAIKEPTNSSPVLMIKGENSRVEIFQLDDFNGERIHGYSSSGLNEFEEMYVPKEKNTIEDYEIWLYYRESDLQSMDEANKIFDSIIIKKFN